MGGSRKPVILVFSLNRVALLFCILAGEFVLVTEGHGNGSGSGLPPWRPLVLYLMLQLGWVFDTITLFALPVHDILYFYPFVFIVKSF